MIMKKPTHTKSGLRTTLYRPLRRKDVVRIVDEAFRILENGGVAVYSEQARSAFRSAGALLSEDTPLVRLPRGLVEDAIESNPSSITLYSRDGGHNAVLEKNRVYYGTGGTALYVLDPETGERRKSVIDDVVLNARLCNELEHVHVFTLNVFPNDVEERDHIDVNRFFHALDNTSKHVMGGVYSFEGCRKVVRMAEHIAGSHSALEAKPFISFITLMISPFKIDQHYGDMACYLSEQGLPLVIPTEPICGTTAPVTLAGNVLVHVAETLAGIALVQSVRKGAPGICGSVGSIPDLYTMNHVGGAIERAMINAAVAQIAQYLKLPLYSTAGTTDAKAVNIQGAYETAMSNLLVAMSGANYIHDAAGLMESDLTVSYEKLVIDNEILGMCQRVLRGIEVTDETLAADLIIDKGPGKSYFCEDHTALHMADEFFMPRLANRDKRAAMLPHDDAYARAQSFVRDIRNRAWPSKLDANVRRRILETFPGIREAEISLQSEEVNGVSCMDPYISKPMKAAS